jgi:predicted ATPase
MAEALSLAKVLNNMQALAKAVFSASILSHLDGNIAEVDRLASELIELSIRHNFVTWLPLGAVHRGWACTVSGDTVKGLLWIDDGIKDYHKRGSSLGLPYFLSLKAEALHLADRTSEALKIITDAQALAEKLSVRWWYAELLRLRGLFLATIGADETLIEVSLSAAMRTAKEQKSISLATRAEGTYAEYRRQKAGGLGGQGFRLPLFANRKHNSTPFEAVRLSDDTVYDVVRSSAGCIRDESKRQGARRSTLNREDLE